MGEAVQEVYRRIRAVNVTQMTGSLEISWQVNWGLYVTRKDGRVRPAKRVSRGELFFLNSYVLSAEERARLPTVEEASLAETQSVRYRVVCNCTQGTDYLV